MLFNSYISTFVVLAVVCVFVEANPMPQNPSVRTLSKLTFIGNGLLSPELTKWLTKFFLITVIIVTHGYRNHRKFGWEWFKSRRFRFRPRSEYQITHHSGLDFAFISPHPSYKSVPKTRHRDTHKMDLTPRAPLRTTPHLILPLPTVETRPTMLLLLIPNKLAALTLVMVIHLASKPWRPTADGWLFLVVWLQCWQWSCKYGHDQSNMIHSLLFFEEFDQITFLFFKHIFIHLLDCRSITKDEHTKPTGQGGEFWERELGRRCPSDTCEAKPGRNSQSRLLMKRMGYWQSTTREPFANANAFFPHVSLGGQPFSLIVFCFQFPRTEVEDGFVKDTTMSHQFNSCVVVVVVVVL